MQKFGRLPVLLNGRIKPLDTVARNSLLIIHGKQTLRTEQGSSHADGLAGRGVDETGRSRPAEDFRDSQRGNAHRAWIESRGREIFFLSRILPHLQDIEQQAALAEKVDAQLRSPFSATSSNF